MTLLGCAVKTPSPIAVPKNTDLLPIAHECDICVLGGSCTGVFAAIRAARLGASVCVVEKQNAFGGVATSSLVNIWHSLTDTAGKTPIIAGLTQEFIERLQKRDCVIFKPNSPTSAYTLNTQELKIELDEVVLEEKITPFFHTSFSEPLLNDEGKLYGVIVETKSGRQVIKAKYFVDATGDADLAYRLGLESYTHDLMQPPTTSANLENFDYGEFANILKEHAKEFNLPEGFIWGAPVPPGNTFMLCGTRMYGTDCSVADELTKAEIEGRRQIRAIMDMMRKYSTNERKLNLVALPSYMGIRESRHIKCLYQVKDSEAMYGLHYDDAIANGSYHFDLHHRDEGGITFKELDGSQTYVNPGHPTEASRWREETTENPTYYQVPLRSLIPPRFDNLILAGRMLDAEATAFSGIRVMVNMNQLGEAAGVTAYLALHHDKAIKDVSAKEVRETLAKGGSIII